MSTLSSALTSLFTACAATPKRKRESKMDRSGSRLPQLRGSATAGSSRSPLEGKRSDSQGSRVGMRLAERPKSMYDIPVSLDATSTQATGNGGGTDEYASACRPTRLQANNHQPKTFTPSPGRGNSGISAPATAASRSPVMPPAATLSSSSSIGQRPGSPASQVRTSSPADSGSDCRLNERNSASGDLQPAGKAGGSAFGFAGSNGSSRPSLRQQQEPNSSRLAFRSNSAAVAKSELPGTSASSGLRPLLAQGQLAIAVTPASSDQLTQLPEQHQIHGRQYTGADRAATGRGAREPGCPVPAISSELPSDGTNPSDAAASDPALSLRRPATNLSSGRFIGGRRPADRRSTADGACRGRSSDTVRALSTSQEADGLDSRSAAPNELPVNGLASDCQSAASDDPCAEPARDAEPCETTAAKRLAPAPAPAAAAAAAPRQSRFGLLNLGATSRRDNIRTSRTLQYSGEQASHSRLNGSHPGASSVSNLSEVGQNSHVTDGVDHATPLLNGSADLAVPAADLNDDVSFGNAVSVLTLQDNVSMQLMLLEMADEVRALRAGLSELQRELQQEETLRHRLQLECAEKDACIADLRRQLGAS